MHSEVAADGCHLSGKSGAKCTRFLNSKSETRISSFEIRISRRGSWFRLRRVGRQTSDSVGRSGTWRGQISVVGAHLACARNARLPIGRRRAAPLHSDFAGGCERERVEAGPRTPALVVGSPVAAVYDRRGMLRTRFGGHRPPPRNIVRIRFDSQGAGHPISLVTSAATFTRKFHPQLLP